MVMRFADELRKAVKSYEEFVDEATIRIIKNKCEEAAEEGKRTLYIENKLGPATRETLKVREGLTVIPSLTSIFTYQISW